MESRSFDIIIAGAGASGLSLLWYLLHSEDRALRNKQILLADRQLSVIRDKTWCFWDGRFLPFEDLIHHSWKSLEVRAFGNTFTGTLSDYSYHCVKSDDYTARIFQLAREAGNVTLLEADILGFADAGGKAEMETSKGTFTAEMIFQSALKPPGLSTMKLDISLKQHFAGWHITSEKPVFDPEISTLMDFDVPQQSGVSFVYVLPFSRHDALVEYTIFSEELISDEGYAHGIESYIRERIELDSSQYKTIYTEKGTIPMEDRSYPARYCDNVWNIGTMGGLTKPSTGYTFTRIHRRNAEIAAALEAGKQPPDAAASPYRFRVYDMMLLYNLHHHPEISVTIFHELFRKNSFDNILGFLEEKTKFPQELKIFSSLPWKPFFKSIYALKHRIATGA